ncbi:MAG TPA: hypothetical protein VHW24_05955 [Bryobacteraceae bacterium]|nr:hypothetical protein [Bryobacteraceae bacterium]
MRKSFNTLNIRGRTFKTLSAALRLAVLGLPFAVLSAQTLGRSVEVETEHNSDAVVVTRIALGETILQCGIPDSPSSSEPVVPVSAGPDWLSQLTLYLLNRTNKTIVYGRIELAFPETGDGRTPQTSMTMVPLDFGLMPPSVAFTGSGQPLRQENTSAVTFVPGQTMALPISAKVYADIQRNLAGRVPNPAAITKLLVRRGPFIFSDNMKWYHTYWLPDPANLGHWVPVADRRYFPGRAVWPPTFPN